MHESTPSVFWEGNFLNRSRGERYAGVTESFKYFLYSFLLAIKYEEAFMDSRIDSYFLHLPLMLDCSLYQLKFGLECSAEPSVCFREVQDVVRECFTGAAVDVIGLTKS
ncbi:hypothetical protein [Pseudomonas aeruginosa]|uniref:hypothetical protein n=1 Tax=Pseudomonas aeruginosa TaxID=287 RepID=UPI000AD6691B|nr:hypothetical protein [Pseudomonas aeruginosa]HEK2508095.1 hypothetical protein [Pseudomonas aeruginosa]